MIEGGGCWHCGEPLPAHPAHATVSGTSHAVCCNGCRAAAEWIGALGLADYYRLRSEVAVPAPDPGLIAGNAAAYARPALARHLVRDLGDGRSEALVLVDGLRCAACSWLIERAIGSLPGVASVEVNAHARRARIVWRPALASLPQIVEALARVGYRALPLDIDAIDDSRRRESRAAMKRLVVAGFGAMQAMMVASVLYLGVVDAVDETTRNLFRWLGLMVATPVVFYAAQPFFAGAVRALAARTVGVDVPVALAIALIYGGSVLAFATGDEVYFESVSMFVFFLLVGRYLEMRARHLAGDSSDALARLAPAFADRYDDSGQLYRVGALELRPGDRVFIAEGNGVPADGILESANCRVDEALLSGESRPVDKRRGDTLVAGTIVVNGTATMQVERIGGNTVLAGIVALTGRAATERPRLAQAGTRAAAAFVAGVLLLAATTALAWGFVDPQRAFSATIAVLVVSCPCAFALAVPAALTRALGVLARRGVLVVRPNAIEGLADATCVMFDKTGTLTEPRLELERIEILRPADRAVALAQAGALASGSSHPVSRAIAAVANHAPLPEVAQFRTHVGDGLTGVVGGRRCRLGRPDFALTDAVQAAQLEDAVVLADDDGAIAAFHLIEQLRPGARAAIDALRAQGLTIAIVSGDAPHRVAAVAARLAVTGWRARMRPADKLDDLAQQRARGERVIVVGDGVNDAPVLAGADVAVAMGAGADLAQAASDIVLTSVRLDALADARALACETMVVLRQNQRFALAYNLTVIPLAALGLIAPWLAALGMSASSLVVVMNALRIGRHQAEISARLPASASATASVPAPVKVPA